MTDYNVNVKMNVDGGNTNDVKNKLNEINNITSKITDNLKTGVNDQLNKIGVNTNALTGKLSKVEVAALAVGAAFTLAASAVTVLLQGLSEGQVLNDLAEKTGVAAEEFNFLRAAAKQADADVKGVTDSFEQFSRILADAQAGKKKAVEQFNAIGVSVEKLKKLNPSEAFYITGQAINSVDDYAVRQKALQAILGSTGAELIKINNEYKDLADAQERTKENMFTDEMLKASQRYDDLIKELKSSVDKLAVSFVNAFGPALVSMIESVTNALKGVGTQTSKIAEDFNNGKWFDALFGRKGERGFSFKAGGFGLTTMGPDFSNVSSGSTTTAGNRPTLDDVRGNNKSTEKDTNAEREKAKELSKAIADWKALEAQYARELLKTEEIANKLRKDTETMQANITRDTKANSEEAFMFQQAFNIEQTKGYQKAQEYLRQQTQLRERELEIKNLMNDAEAKGVILSKEQLDALRQSIDMRNQAANRFADGQDTILGVAVNDNSVWQQWSKNIEDIGLNLDGIANSFADTFAEGLASGKLNFKSFLADLAKQLIKSAIIKLIAQFFGGSLGGGTSFNGVGGMFAKGGAFNNGTQFFATGGVVNRATPFGMSGGKMGVMGEAGPEAILPLSRMGNGKLGVAATGGGSSNVSIQNVINISGDNGSPDETARQTSKALNDLMETKVRQILKDERRVGNSLNQTKQII